MLARAHRLVSAEDYRRVLRRGRRAPGTAIVVSVLAAASEAPARFGFVVSRKVGNAVIRNRVRRRLKAIAWELVEEGMAGLEVVVRALPQAASSEWATLHSEFRTAMEGRTAR